MRVTRIIDPKAGEKFAVVDLEMTDEERDLLLEYAVVNILKEQIEKIKNKYKRVCFDCGGEINGYILKEFPDTEICAECLNDE